MSMPLQLFPRTDDPETRNPNMCLVGNLYRQSVYSSLGNAKIGNVKLSLPNIIGNEIDSIWICYSGRIFFHYFRSEKYCCQTYYYRNLE